MIKRKDTEKKKTDGNNNEYFHIGGVLTTQYFTLVCKNSMLYTSLQNGKWKSLSPVQLFVIPMDSIVHEIL